MLVVKNRGASVSLVALFVALMTVGAYIKIPTPLAPVSLQVLVCLTAALLLGWRKAAACMLTYIVMGLLGLPVFTAGGGFSYAVNPTFGYIVGFLPAAMICGKMSEGAHSFKRCLLACLAGVAVIYLIGCPYLYCIGRFWTHSGITVWRALLYGCIIFLPTDITWCVVSSSLSVRVARVVGNSTATHNEAVENKGGHSQS